MDNNLNLIKGLINLYPEKIFFKNLLQGVQIYPELVNENFLSQGQVESKKWLIRELKNLNINLGVIYLVPGWYGLLAQFIDDASLKYEKIRSFDIDQKAVDISDLLNKNLLVDGWKFKASCKDILKIDYKNHIYNTLKKGVDCEVADVPDTIINTACEHIDYQEWLKLLPENKIVVLQNNDFTSCNEHVSCVSSLQEFIDKSSLKEVMYSGTLKLEKYNRYMIIGRT